MPLYYIFNRREMVYCIYCAGHPLAEIKGRRENPAGLRSNQAVKRAKLPAGGACGLAAKFLRSLGRCGVVGGRFCLQGGVSAVRLVIA